jgi:NAD(P)-dependent dehydrogenase (short-subunit alcohol dehydrogenase family)
MFARAGADVALLHYSPDGQDISDVLKDVVHQAGRAFALDVDVREAGQVDAAVKRAQSVGLAPRRTSPLHFCIWLLIKPAI